MSDMTTAMNALYAAIVTLASTGELSSPTSIDVLADVTAAAGGNIIIGASTIKIVAVNA